VGIKRVSKGGYEGSVIGLFGMQCHIELIKWAIAMLTMGLLVSTGTYEGLGHDNEGTYGQSLVSIGLRYKIARESQNFDKVT